MCLALCAFLCTFAMSAPAGALTINGVDYVLFGKKAIRMENGPINIIGNVAVNDVGGLLNVGAFNIITGTATADVIKVPKSAQITACRFNNSDPDAAIACGTTGPAVLPITTWPPLPVPVIPACVSSAPDFIVPDNGTSLPAGSCLRNVRLKNGATLTLSAGTYNFRTLFMGAGSSLIGNGATVNLLRGFNTESNVSVLDVMITSVASGFEVIEPGHKSLFDNVVLYAPNGRIHLHSGATYNNFEAIGETLAVQPIQGTQAAQNVCACIGQVADGGSTIMLSNGCHLNDPGNVFFVSPTCAIDAFVSCPGPNCIATGAPTSSTDTTATLNKPAANPGDYHVIVRNTGGAFCTVQTVHIP
jgi:hypothetical protein